MTENILNEINYSNPEIEKWIKTTYKNHFLRQKKEINKDKLIHLMDFLISSYAPKNLQGKSFGSIMKSLKNWENMLIQADSSEIIEEKVFEKDDLFIVKLCSKNALIQDCSISKSSAILNDRLIVKERLVIRNSKIKLPKKLEVFGDFIIDYCEIEEFPEEMIVHGCFDFNGDYLPPNFGKYKINSKKIFLAKEGLIEFD